MFNPISATPEVNQLFEQLSQERKALQAKGHLPHWYTTQAWQMFKSRYMVQGELAIRGRHRKIASTLSSHLPQMYRKEYRKKFFDLMWENVLSPSSPALANTGTSRGQSVACSGQYISDDVDGFYTGVRETALLSKHAYGTSGYFGDIRGRGTKFGTNGKANGAKEVIEDYFTAARKISQGGNRTGSFAAYINMDHPDFYECLWSLKAEPKGRNYGWCISDEFTARLLAGDEDANQRFTDTLHVKLLTGKGYLFFPDKANRHRPEMYKRLGLDVKASNLCVSPETLVLTDQGHLTIKDLKDKTVNVWNGTEYSGVVVRQTGINQKLLTVTTDSGFSLDCTPYHRFYVQPSYSQSSIVMKEAKDLVKGDKLIKLNTPIIEGTKVFSDAYQNGFYSGDGCTVTVGSKVQHRVYLYGSKRKLIDLFLNKEGHRIQDNLDREYFNLPNLKTKFTVPTSSDTIKSRLEWLAGYLDADGSVARVGQSQTVQVASVNPIFIREVQLMLQTLGVQSKITHTRSAGNYKLPANDGSGNNKEYNCRAVERLLISGNAIYDLLVLGLKTNRLDLNTSKPQREATRFIKVVSVLDHGRVDDTYCFTEHKKHLGVFNGLLTGQCSEILLHSSLDFTYSCILASLNLVHWDRIKDDDSIFTAMVFLDCLCSESIKSSKGIKGLEKVRNFTIKGRATGLGVMGFHTYLQQKGILYDSLHASQLNYQIFKRLHDESLRASQWLAKILGEPEWCKGTGLRNTHRTAIAPTKSTALLMGGVSESTFADPGVTFTAGSSVGELDRITPVFYELMKTKGIYNQDTMKRLSNSIGSIQGMDDLFTKEEQLLFRNAFEMDPFATFRMAKARQKWLCQGQSLNFHIPDENAEDLTSKLMSAVVLDPDIISAYYLYTRSGVVVTDECINCQA